MVFARLAFACLALASACSLSTAQAASPTSLASDALAAGTIAAGQAAVEKELAARPDDAEAAAALGVLQFAGAIEHFTQALYRHGFEPGGRGYGPLLRLPIPINPKPEPLDYQGFRAIFAKLSDDLNIAERTLSAVGEKPVLLHLNPALWRIDIDGDGKGSEQEGLLRLGFPDGVPPELQTKAVAFSIGFDTADIYWLRGYTNVLGVVADFWLAHDFKETFDSTFHILFPKAGLPYAGVLATGTIVEGMSADELADAIALIHQIRWPVAEPARYEGIRQRLLSVINLNRLTWKSVRAETDDDREWLPSPRQKSGVVLGGEITDERIDAWLAALSEAEDVLEGRKLLPHWRFKRGIDLKKLAANPRPFDLVLWATGHAALPYLADGPVADWAAWRSANAIFQGNLTAYAFWFN